MSDELYISLGDANWGMVRISSQFWGDLPAIIHCIKWFLQRESHFVFGTRDEYECERAVPSI